MAVEFVAHTTGIFYTQWCVFSLLYVWAKARPKNASKKFDFEAKLRSGNGEQRSLLQ